MTSLILAALLAAGGGKLYTIETSGSLYEVTP
jgi:hypothetical protein